VVIVSDAGDRSISQIVADILPGSFTGSGIVGYIEDMPWSLGRVGVVTSVADKSMVGVLRIDRNATDEATWLSRGIDTGEGDS